MIEKFLGIDYGASKVGLAIADRETRMAFQYGMLINNKNLLEKLAEIIEKEGIGKIIIGNHMEIRSPYGNRISESIREIEKFRRSLQDKLNIPIEYQNEMFTTKMAERNLKEKGMKQIKKYDDQEAARIILQSWLDKKK